jgi:prolyl oligopeptidase
MEDLDSPETREWVLGEARVTSGWFAHVPARAGIVTRLTALENYERWFAPERYGTRWFYLHNDGLQNQNVLFTATGVDAAPRVLLDPNAFSTHGTVALTGSGITQDGRFIAYGLSEAGSDWEVWRVRDTETGRDLPDEIRWAKFTGASWLKDGSGFYYAGYAPPKTAQTLKAPSEYHSVFFHRLGTPQSADVLIYRRTDDTDWYLDHRVTDDGRYLVVAVAHGTDVRNLLLVGALHSAAKPDLQAVIPEPTASYQFIGNIGSVLYVLTDDAAPRYRILAIDVARPDRAHWKTVVPEAAETLAEATLVGGQLIGQYLKEAHSVVRRFAPDGTPFGEVALPGLGTTSGFSGHDADKDSYFSYSDYTHPEAVYRLDLKSGRTELWRAPKLAAYESDRYETRQVFYASKDGTRIPMLVTARRGTVLDGSHPTILYAYGGFNVSILPAFKADVAEWLELGGVYAVANLRGGGEYGRAWHEAGMKTHKQTVFDDFIAAAEYLIAEHWTSPKRLAIRGRSNGGLLIGAVLEQRPELFAAALANVGVMDMLRFREFTVGKGWESDYGSVDAPEEFKALLAYSPYHNVRSGVAYPATLILTGDHDDRVFPAHSFKFAAAMQHADPNGNPILIRIDTDAGHGAGKPLSKRVEESADEFAFALQAMGLGQ